MDVKRLQLFGVCVRKSLELGKPEMVAPALWSDYTRDLPAKNIYNRSSRPFKSMGVDTMQDTEGGCESSELVVDEYESLRELFGLDLEASLAQAEEMEAREGLGLFEYERVRFCDDLDVLWLTYEEAEPLADDYLNGRRPDCSGHLTDGAVNYVLAILDRIEELGGKIPWLEHGSKRDES